MASERWRKFEELSHAARQCDSSERSAFLADACSADDELKRNVQSLLAQDPADNILNTPPASVGQALSPAPDGWPLGPQEFCKDLLSRGVRQRVPLPILLRLAKSPTPPFDSCAF